MSLSVLLMRLNWAEARRCIGDTLGQTVKIALAFTASSLVAINLVHAAEKTIFFHNDISGTPLAASDESGNVIWKETYKPYGERINNAAGSAIGKGKNELYFHGKQQDTLKGGVTLQYFGARYYSPELGPRFLGVDPVHFSPSSVHSFNRFAYGNNNPYRFRDPDGNVPIDTIVDIGAVVWDAGRALGAAAAFAHGAFSGNQSLKSAGAEGLRESGIDLGISVGAAFAPYVSAGMMKGGIKVVDEAARYTPGGKFSKSTKELSAERAGGKCEYCGTETVAASKSQRGVTPPKNEAQTDHIVPRTQGGSNSPDNAAHACRDCNRQLSDLYKPNPRGE